MLHMNKQTQKYIKSHRHRFSTTGDLGVWSGLKLFYEPDINNGVKK
jgi:hypothetical protein